MSVNVTFNGNNYAIPNTAGESGWTSLTDYLVALAANAATQGAFKQAIRVATSSPVTVAATDATVVSDLTVAGPVAVSLPAGVTKQFVILVDGKGDAGTNNVTITGNGGQLINGNATLVLNTNYQGCILQFDGTQWRVLANVKNSTGSIVNADIAANANIALSKLANVPTGSVLIGDGSNKALPYNVDGDVTIGAGGISAIKPGVIIDADVNAAAAIARTKLASGTADHVLINSGTGVASSEAQLAPSRGGTGTANTGSLNFGANALTLTTTGATNVTLPTTGTLATRAVAESLTNKTFDDTSNVAIVGGNTRTNSFGLGTADAFSFFLKSNNVNRLQILDTANLSTADVIHLGTSGLALSAGTTAQRPSTPLAGTIRYNSTITSLEGLYGATWRSIATRDGTETFTNKTLDDTSNAVLVGGNTRGAAFSVGTVDAFNLNLRVNNQTKLSAQSPANALVTGDLRVLNSVAGMQIPSGLTSDRPSAPLAGTMRYNTDLAAFEGYGAAWSPLGGGSSSGVNVIPSASQNGASGWVSTSATPTTDTNTSNNPLSGVTSSVLSVASSTLGGYAAIRWTQPSGLQNQPINVSFWSKLTAASDYKVELYYNSASNYGGAYTRVTLNSDVAGVSNLNGGSTQFKTFFVEQGQSFYELRLVRTAASAATAYFTQVGVGILSQLGNGFAGQDDQSYPPTYTGFGTTTGSNLSYSRVGDKLRVHGRFTTGTVAATIASISLPTGLSIDTSKLINGNEVVGKWWRNNATGTTRKTGSLNTQIGTSTQLIYFGNDDYTAANAPATALLGNDMFNNAELAFVSFEVPITGWSSNVTMADRALDEWLAKTSTWATSDLTTANNVYGPNGAQGGTTTPAGQSFTFRVTTQSAIQATDAWEVEISEDRVNWARAPYIGTVITGAIEKLRYDGAAYIGVSVKPVSSTTADVTFGKYAFGTTGAWNGTWYWRARRTSGGASVGFPVGARNVVGDVSGTAVPAGMLGETISSRQTSYASVGATGTRADLLTLTLSPGVWDLSANLSVNLNGATMTAWDSFIGGTAAGNNATGLLLGDNTMEGPVPIAAVNSGAAVSAYRVVISVTTTFYMKMQAVYSAGTPRWAGRFSAVRVG